MAEYRDLLGEYMRGRAKRFVEEMGDHYPAELLELKQERPQYLAELIAEWATSTLRGVEDAAILKGAFMTVTSIAWAKKQKEGD
ncbi:hypothetical protein LCGC14_1981630 [marine sediment metagenome]|uniref:Uncharacterized protein n=1 Tax=marine sediment metagenome TaxID=412755 RepID=A0A0F9HM22_9ZZZZ